MDEEVQLRGADKLGVTLEQFREFTKDLPGSTPIVPRFAVYPPDHWPAVQLEGYSVREEADHKDRTKKVTVIGVMLSEHLLEDLEDDELDEEDDDE